MTDDEFEPERPLKLCKNCVYCAAGDCPCEKQCLCPYSDNYMRLVDSYDSCWFWEVKP